MLAGLLAASIVGVAIIARKGAAEGRKTAIPFGPFLALGGIVGLLAGEPIVDWYLAPSPDRAPGAHGVNTPQVTLRGCR